MLEALLGVEPIQGREDLTLGGHGDVDRHAGDKPQVVHGIEFQRVHHGHHELSLLNADRYEGITLGDLGRYQGHRCRVHDTGVQTDHRYFELPGQGLGDLHVIGHPHVHKHLAELFFLPLLFSQRFGQGFGIDEAGLDQNLAEFSPPGLAGFGVFFFGHGAFLLSG